ncbi:MAG: glycosyltransferase [Candidatus Eremiobacteraeota bacterium]|nr:glycosyltransferase [Candidatus Eremiobacteraeota bacterium]
MSLNRRPKILFLSANAGTGHTIAAKALKKSLRMIDPSVSCEIVNSYKFLNLILEKVMEEGYLHLIRLLPKLYGYFYERKNKKKTIKGLKDWLNRACASNLKKMIDERNPDLIVCTHAFPCGVLSVIKQKYGLDQKILGVVTDFVISPFWLYEETDMYLIATEDLKNNVIERGIDSSRVVTTGIPIDPNFSIEVDKKELRKKLGFDSSLPLILVMGGGLGMSPVTGILRTLKKINTPFQAVIVFGKNIKLKKKVDETLLHLPKFKNRIRTLDYVDNIHEYMKASDLLITKPGGMTTAEAIAVGLPMILTSPIPGQETRNTRYLMDKGVGVRVYREKDLSIEVERLLSNPLEREEMVLKTRELAAPKAAGEAARQIYGFLPK